MPARRKRAQRADSTAVGKPRRKGRPSADSYRAVYGTAFRAAVAAIHSLRTGGVRLGTDTMAVQDDIAQCIAELLVKRG